MATFPTPIPPDPPLPVHPPALDYHDPASYSRPGIHFTEHIDMNLTLDIRNKRIHAQNLYTIRNLDRSVPQLILDARGITIINVMWGTQPLPYNLTRLDSQIGNALEIELPENVRSNEMFVLTVTYRTPGNGDGHPAGGALDWLSREQTSSAAPFAYTQCQDIHARSILPCQDTHAVKSTYSAVVQVINDDDALTFLMASQRVPLKEGDPPAAVRFECGVPIPSYLIAFACGKLTYREVSHRCAVWAEPDVIDEAEFEFQPVEDILQSAEAISGKYVWGRYDLIVLPSSFPYGGMENPFLTFVTPTLLVGDRSLVNVITHEIAHSWSGNLVSCRDFRDFWMNEGFTVKLERRIIREMNGTGREGLNMTQGRHDLDDFIKSVGEDSKLTKLVPPLQDEEDPDLYFSVLLYEKGCNFLLLLEQMINEQGGDFDAWLKDYFNINRYQSIDTTNGFVKPFTQAFPRVAEKVDMDTWLYAVGPCPQLADIDTSLVEAAVLLASSWLVMLVEVDGMEYEKALDMLHDDPRTLAEEFGKWDAMQQLAFINEMRSQLDKNSDSVPWNASGAGYLDEIYGLNEMRNSEIRLMWYRLALSGEYEKVITKVEDFVSIQGRMKYVRPMYSDLHNVYPKGSFAVDLFEKLKSSYHSITVKMVSQDLGLA